jgi:hypothetical protein
MSVPPIKLYTCIREFVDWLVFLQDRKEAGWPHLSEHGWHRISRGDWRASSQQRDAFQESRKERHEISLWIYPFDFSGLSITWENRDPSPGGEELLEWHEREDELGSRYFTGSDVFEFYIYICFSFSFGEWNKEKENIFYQAFSK